MTEIRGQGTADGGPQAGGKERETDEAGWLLSPVPCPLIALLLVVLPIFGHGCHGDDVDHEPSVPVEVRP
jgi:hypothetical protein